MSRIVRSALAVAAGVAALAGGVTVAAADEARPQLAPAATTTAVSTSAGDPGDARAAATAAPAPSAVQLRAAHSDKCLTIPNASLRNGVNSVQSACAADAGNQQIDLVPTGAGTFELRFGHSGKCLDVEAAGTKSGTVVQQWWCVGAQNQRWRLVMVDIANELYELRPAHTPAAMNRCLDVESSSKADGAAARLWACNGSAAQQWRVHPATAA
ncbi:RICIN domain-containing protein [Streptomyces sp. NPDC050585]|uniref:RICIN domain-containing protein n=1 Tax=Streptomyces sp. NPDC050585 TaxID=3365632 RepID=UPI0037BE1291